MPAQIVAPAAAPAWLRLLRAPGLGGARIRELLNRHGTAAAALDAGAAGWRAAGLPAAAISALQQPDAARLDADLAWLDGADHHLLTCDSPDFPTLLARSPHAPAALFVVGTPTALWHPQIGVVGSRNPTEGGRDNAADFAATLARAGLAITSGLAEGIDTAAHAATIGAGGLTLAVMGTGPDRIYPAGQKSLARRIVDSGGALVTELPPGVGAQREHFPRRNRIIAGLSLGVLVVEAAQRSGALITARQAAEAGREVFAIPGSIHNPLARGCHRLIREGVALVETAQEIVDALGPMARELGAALRLRLDPAADSAPADGAGRNAGDDRERARLWQALGHDPVDMDQLAGRTGLTVPALSSMLLHMELEGRISVANGRYARRGGS
jgi:DNA processing protein